MAERIEEPRSPKDKPRTPEMATAARGVMHPFLDPRPPYYLVYHPARWMVLAGKLVPSLSTFVLSNGVQNVTVEKDNRIRFATARAKLEEQGRTVVPWSWAPDGESYLRCVDTRPGGGQDVVETWISVFETVDAGATETSSDEDAYAAWLSKLVDDGRLPKCSVNVARRLLDRASSRLEEARADAAKLGGHGRATIRAQALEVEVEALAAYVGQGKAEKAKPKSKRIPEVKEEGL